MNCLRQIENSESIKNERDEDSSICIEVQLSNEYILASFLKNKINLDI